MGIPISGLNEATEINDSAVFPVVDDNGTEKITALNLLKSLKNSVKSTSLMTFMDFIGTPHGLREYTINWEEELWIDGSYKAIGKVTVPEETAIRFNNNSAFFIDDGKLALNPTAAFADVTVNFPRQLAESPCLTTVFGKNQYESETFHYHDDRLTACIPVIASKSTTQIGLTINNCYAGTYQENATTAVIYTVSRYYGDIELILTGKWKDEEDE